MALAAAIAGAIIGDSVGYEVGKKWGDKLLTRLPHRFVKPEHIQQGKDLINRLGGKAVFTGRFAAALRALVPGLCGVSRVPYRKFLFWNALGGIAWATGFTLLGYAAGNAWHKVEHYASLVSWVLLGLAVAGGLALFLVKKRKKAASPDDGDDGGTRERARERGRPRGQARGRGDRGQDRAGDRPGPAVSWWPTTPRRPRRRPDRRRASERRLGLPEPRQRTAPPTAQRNPTTATGTNPAACGRGTA